jgi:hypothetical protein
LLTLQGRTVALKEGKAVLTWASPIWPNSTVSARAALIYNLSRSNRSIAVLDLGLVVSSTNGSFIVNMPEDLIEL